MDKFIPKEKHWNFNLQHVIKFGNFYFVFAIRSSKLLGRRGEEIPINATQNRDHFFTIKEN